MARDNGQTQGTAAQLTQLVLADGATGGFVKDSDLSGGGVVIVAPTITTSITPTSDDGAALGSTGLEFSDLFLASGGVINWANGDVTLTHAANNLLFAGASSGYTFDAIVYPTANDGAALGDTTHNWSDLFLASGAVLNFNAGNVTVTHSAGLLTSNGNLTISKASATSTLSATSGNSFFVVDRVAGSLAAVSFKTANSERWRIAANTTAEGGANAGSDFIWQAYDDSGALIGSAFSIVRASMLFTHGGGVVLAAGTTALGPLKFTSGTNLTSAVAGTLEYDGICFYATAATSSRQVNDCEQFVTTGATPHALPNDNALNPVFDSANDVLQLAASTTYFFEAMYYVNTGNTTHTTATAFTASSAFTSIRYFAELWSGTAVTISTTAPSVLDVVASTATVLNATSTATRTTIRIKGIIRTNASSTVTPAIQFSANPTGTCEVATNSFFRIWPVGSNVVAAVGNWA